MGVREETLELLHQGLSPKEIAREKGVNIKTTLAYLDELVGRGALRRSDIFFSIPKNIRNANKERGVSTDYEDSLVINKYGDASTALGDMYEDIRTVETYLHQLISSALEEEYGKGEMGWWRKGIPLSIRQDCQSRREADDEPATEPYCYTNLLDLWQILDKQWNVLKKVLPNNITADKQALRFNLIRLNSIRRKVMHPVRGVIPSEDDFEFIREFKGLLLSTTKVQLFGRGKLHLEGRQPLLKRIPPSLREGG